MGNHDETFLIFEDKRYPTEGTWDFAQGESKYKYLTLDKRVETSNNDVFESNLVLWEKDLLGKNRLREINIRWEADFMEFEEHIRERPGYDHDFHYILTFDTISNTFSDPSPLDEDGDFDNDGLNDTTEYDLNNDDAYGDIDGRAHPMKQDIFVEVDGMHKKNGGAHMLSDLAASKVVTRFAEHDIRLHIDRGRMGGGGDLVEYEEHITFGQRDPNNPDIPDFYDEYKNGGYYQNSRENKFHYVIFCDGCWANSGTGFNGDRAGRGEINGDDFVVCSSKSKYTFMHELGHNLGLDHSMEKDGTFPYAEYNTKSEAKKSVMYWRSSEANGFTYDKLWPYIDLNGVVDGD